MSTPRPTSTPLTPALTSLHTSLSLLNSSLAILDTGTRDLPRLTRVLSQTRHFELAPSSALHSAQDDVLSELRPEIERLFAQAEKVVEGRERREEWLRARWALGEGRLGREGPSGPSASAGKTKATASTAGTAGKGGAAAVDTAKAQRLRQKKERLSYAVERLQLQANQKERQLRMSMAAQEPKEVDKVGTKNEDDDGEYDF